MKITFNFCTNHKQQWAKHPVIWGQGRVAEGVKINEYYTGTLSQRCKPRWRLNAGDKLSLAQDVPVSSWALTASWDCYNECFNAMVIQTCNSQSFVQCNDDPNESYSCVKCWWQFVMYMFTCCTYMPVVVWRRKQFASRKFWLDVMAITYKKRLCIRKWTIWLLFLAVTSYM